MRNNLEGIFNRLKEQKIISVILCLIIIHCIISGIKWVYNDIVYGRFVKVAEINKGNYIFSLYETEDTNSKNNDILFYISEPKRYIVQSKFGPEKEKSCDGFEQTENYFIYHIYGIKYYEIYDKSAALSIHKNIKNGYYYLLDEKNKQLIQKSYSNKEEKDPVKPFLINKDNNNYTDSTLTTKGKVQKIKRTTDVIELDKDNLFLYASYYRNSQDYNAYRYSVKENKLYEVDTDDIPNKKTCRECDDRGLIYLGNYKFLSLISEDISGKLIKMELYELKNNKFVKLEYTPPKNYSKLRISPEKFMVLDENKVLFLSESYGFYGSYIHHCYLYDLKKNKIVRINNFPISLKEAYSEDVFKTKSGEFYLPLYNEKIEIYKYQK